MSGPPTLSRPSSCWSARSLARSLAGPTSFPLSRHSNWMDFKRVRLSSYRQTMNPCIHTPDKVVVVPNPLSATRSCPSSSSSTVCFLSWSALFFSRSRLRTSFTSLCLIWSIECDFLLQTPSKLACLKDVLQTFRFADSERFQIY